MSKKKKKSKPATVVMCGSGTGGHVTPVLAVAEALKSKSETKAVKVVYIGQSGDKMGDLLKDQKAIDKHLTVMSGKWRRYHGRGLRQLLDIPTMLRNIRDVFFVFVGFIESLYWLRKIHPTALFIKGGGIGVPVGLAAALYKIPIITHDSDAQPGLANRIVARWAATHTVSMPPEFYSYPPEDTVQVGIPIAADFAKAASADKAEMRKRCEIDPDKRTILIFGGSLGGRRLIKIVLKVLDDLLELGQVVHIVGESGYKKMSDELKNRPDYTVLPFVKGRMHEYIAAADVVIMRAGATAIAEVATVGRPMILIPNAYLTGGHQTENAKIYDEAGAAVNLVEKELEADSQVLVKETRKLFDKKNTVDMLKAQTTMVRTDPAAEIADIIAKSINRSLKVRQHGAKKKV